MPRRQETIAPDAKLMQLEDAAALIGAGGKRYVVWLLRHHYLTAVMFKSVRLVSREAVEAFCREAERYGRLPDEDFVWPQSRDPRLPKRSAQERETKVQSPLRLLRQEPCKTQKIKTEQMPQTSPAPRPQVKRRQSKSMAALQAVISGV